MKKTVVYSTGLTTRTILEIFETNRDGSIENVVGLLDDDVSKIGQEHYKQKVLGGLSSLDNLIKSQSINCFILGIGAVKHIAVRERLFQNLLKQKLIPINCISKAAYISLDSQIGKGNLILPFAVIGSGTVIGDNSIITASVSILENSVIGDNVHIGSNSFLGGACSVGDNTYIGPGSTVVSGVSIGRNVIVGAGSVVLKDIPENSFGFGNPYVANGANKYYP